jgi:hypothetical protein
MLNFIYIGPDKSGSTWLFNVFKQHRDIFVPDAKDIYFFDRYYDKGMKWYLGFFKKAKGNEVVGEISHDYMFDTMAMERIQSHFPDIKIFTILRNPFEKIWSQYLFLIRSGITNKPFKIAIKEEKELIDKCLYAKHLSSYIKNFDQENFKVFYFDDLKNEPKELAKEIFEFLDVVFDENIDYYEKTLPASKPNSFFIAKMAKKSAIFLREIGLVNLLGKIKSNKLINKILYKPYTKENKPKMTQEEFDMVYEVFKDDLEKLEKILNKDFSHWLKFKG